MKKYLAFFLSVLIGSVVICGCSRRIGSIYFSASLSDTYMAAADQANLTVKECNLIFMDYQNRYNSYYSRAGMGGFWDTEVEGTTFAEYLKENRIKEEICVLLLLNDMAKERKLSLTVQEKADCDRAAFAYYSSLTQMEIDFCQATQRDVASLYQKYRLAQKLIASLTDGAYLEISDNDKRVITLQIICTASQSEAQSLWSQVTAGADFLQLARDYGTLSRIEYQVSRGTLNPLLEEVAFYLVDDEISDVIEADGNYYIIKCVEDFDEELSMANEDAIYRQSLYEHWGPAVEEYASQHEIAFDMKLWPQMQFYETNVMTSDNLYTVYSEYLSDTF